MRRGSRPPRVEGDQRFMEADMIRSNTSYACAKVSG